MFHQANAVGFEQASPLIIVDFPGRRVREWTIDLQDAPLAFQAHQKIGFTVLPL